MAKRQKVWMRVKALSAERKPPSPRHAGDFIADTLKPRFLPEIRPTQFNYPVDLFGKWRGNKYSFVTRFRGWGTRKTWARNSTGRSRGWTMWKNAFRRRGSM